MNGANYAAFNVDAAGGLEFTDFGARGRSSGSSSLENQTVYRGPQNEGYKPSAASQAAHVLPVGPYNPSRATAHGQSQQQHSFLQMAAAGMSVDDYLRQDQLLNSFLGAAAPSFGQHSANRVPQYQQHTPATNPSGPFDPIPMQQMPSGNSNRGQCFEDFLSSHLQMHLTSAAASVDHSGGGSNYISGSSSDQLHEPWLEEIKVEVASLSLKPLSGVEIITRLQKRMDDVITKFLPCVHFLVECQQDLRKGLVEAQRRVGSGRQYVQRQRMTPKQFFQTFVDPLPVKFMMKNEHVMDRTALNEAVTGLENLRKEAKVSSETSCEAVKNTFLGGMKEGESWGLRKWLSRHGNALAVCTDLECILKACKALDKNMESTKKLAKLLRPIASQTLTRLKTEVPASYQERSSAHPYLPFFHRLESALRDVSQFDPDDDGIILLDDSDDEDDVVVEIVKKPPPEPKPKPPTKSHAKRKADDPPPAKAQLVKPIQIQATILPSPEDDRSEPGSSSGSDEECEVIEVVGLKTGASETSVSSNWRCKNCGTSNHSATCSSCGTNENNGTNISVFGLPNELDHLFANDAFGDESAEGPPREPEPPKKRRKKGKVEQDRTSHLWPMPVSDATYQAAVNSALRIAEKLDELAVYFRENRDSEVVPMNAPRHSFWRGQRYADALELFANVLRSPEAPHFLNRVDEDLLATVLESQQPGLGTQRFYRHVLRSPLCLKDVASALIVHPDSAEDEGYGNGRLPGENLTNWNMWNGKDLLHALDLVFLNSLAFGKKTNEGRSNHRNRTNRLRQFMWGRINEITAEHGPNSNVRKKEYTPTRRAETSGFVLHKIGTD